jgi:N-ethylmaleimide reductase
MILLFEPRLLGGTIPAEEPHCHGAHDSQASEGDVPNELMATYYGQRASAGLSGTEAADVAPSSKGHDRTPGIYTEVQRHG